MKQRASTSSKISSRRTLTFASRSPYNFASVIFHSSTNTSISFHSFSPTIPLFRRAWSFLYCSALRNWDRISYNVLINSKYTTRRSESYSTLGGSSAVWNLNKLSKYNRKKQGRWNAKGLKCTSGPRCRGRLWQILSSSSSRLSWHLLGSPRAKCNLLSPGGRRRRKKRPRKELSLVLHRFPPRPAHQIRILQITC